MNPEVILFQGEWIMATWMGPRSDAILADVNRFEEVEGRVAQVWEYYFSPEVIAAVAAEVGATPLHGYHQPPDILSRMIATTVLPWVST